MLYRITHLKAPWPSRAVVGDVIELDAVPAWALGKCEPAPEATEPTVLTDEQRAELQRQADALAQEQMAARLAAAEREEQERQARDAEQLRQQQEAEAAQRAAAEAAAAQAAAQQQAPAEKPADPTPAEKPAKGKAK